MAGRKQVNPIIEITEEVPWQRVAFDLWCRGHRRWEPICRTCQELHAQGKLADRPTDGRAVKRAVLKEISLTKSDDEKDPVDPCFEYIAGLEADLLETDRLVRSADNASAKCGALRLKRELREMIAAAKGVVTKRAAAEVSGANGGPLQVEHGFDPDCFDGKPQARDAAYALARALTGPTPATTGDSPGESPDNGAGADGEG